MARKFLYIVAGLVVLALATLLAMRLWSEQLTELAFVPKTEYRPQAPLPPSVYDDAAMWYSRPGLGARDPARWLPEGLVEDGDAIGAAVFFVHPTSYLEREHWNAPLDDPRARERAELFVRAMASPFNKSPNLWAPRYRQAAFGAFLTDAPEAAKALDDAYGDVLLAFDYFLTSIGKDTPIVLAGHSQGAFHLKRLLRERVAGTPLARRIVAAYAIGWPLSLDHDLPAMGLPACAAPEQTGCALSWLSFAEPADADLILKGYSSRLALDGQDPKGTAFLCSNPLTGSVGGEAPASANLGTLVPSLDLKSGKLVPGLVPARCRPDGLLSIGDPPALGPYVLPGNNYHVYDIPLFWANLRADFIRRAKSFRP